LEAVQLYPGAHWALEVHWPPNPGMSRLLQLSPRALIGWQTLKFGVPVGEHW
jgi:hypothetical protein